MSAYRNLGQVLHPVVFFTIVVSLFPLSVTPLPETLSLIAPGVIWVAALLATLLSLDSLYRTDYEDGSIEQLVLAPCSKVIVVFAKVLAHWLSSGVPLIIISPLLGVLMHLNGEGIKVTMLSLLIGTPVLSLLGAIGMGLTVSLGRSGMLLSILVLPLYIPVLIFGASAIAAAQMGLAYSGQLAFLGALLSLSISLAPIAAAAALRIAVR